MLCADQRLTLESFLLLAESDLEQLGFKPVERKLLAAWINKSGASMSCCVLMYYFTLLNCAYFIACPV